MRGNARNDLWEIWSALGGRESTDDHARISPLIMRSELPEFLRRRRRCVTKMEVTPAKFGLTSVYKVDTLKVIPKTTARDGREVPSNFIIGHAEEDFAFILSAANSDTYRHGVGLLERSAYPLALHPFASPDLIAAEIGKFASENVLSLRVMQMRAVSARDSSKLQIHGDLSLEEAQIKTRGTIVQGLRLRGLDGDGNEQFRVRVDSACRLMVEKWGVSDSPMQLALRIARLANRAVAPSTKTFGDADRPISTVILPFNRSQDEAALLELVRLLSAQSGMYIFRLDESLALPLHVVDFVTGANCRVVWNAADQLALVARNSIHPAFVEQVQGFLRRLESEPAVKRRTHV